MKNNRFAIALISTLVIFVFIVAIGPMDIFSHGYFYEEVDLSQEISEDYFDNITLTDGSYSMTFTPLKKHMVGFEIYLQNQPEDNTGYIVFDIFNSKGKQVDSILVDLSKVTQSSWYKLYTSARLKMGKEYTLTVSAKDAETLPEFFNVDSDYLPNETLSGNMVITYAYAESTFTFQNKVLISIFLIAVWILILSLLWRCSKWGTVGKYISIVLFITSFLSWNYMYNSMDVSNTRFDQVESSKWYVTGVVDARHYGVTNNDGSKYHLGSCISALSEYTDDENWIENYYTKASAIVVDSNEYSQKYAVTGNYILFGNGDCLRIESATDNGDTIIMFIEADRILNSGKYGSLSDAMYCDDNMEVIAPVAGGILRPYRSQFGLQGIFFGKLSTLMDYDTAVDNLKLICSIICAFVFAVIIILVRRKYDLLMAGIFLYTFWLSPWVATFGSDLYWVMFTWFMPMVIGLICSLKLDEKKIRIACYISAFVTISVKCLCGYEYISAIMMGMISFLLVDFAKTIFAKDKEKALLIFRTIFILGVCAIAGFMFAICIHANLRGDGNIAAGIKDIFEYDVLRRTTGGNLNEFEADLWDSFNASVWEVLCRYFRFDTEIVTGLPANLFPVLCIAPICLFIYDFYVKRHNIEQIAMYCVFFLTSISWFCLAKSHSAIHVHLNFVLWYFGYVQVCLYVLIDRFRKSFHK